MGERLESKKWLRCPNDEKVSSQVVIDRFMISNLHLLDISTTDSPLSLASPVRARKRERATPRSPWTTTMRFDPKAGNLYWYRPWAKPSKRKSKPRRANIDIIGLGFERRRRRFWMEKDKLQLALASSYQLTSHAPARLSRHPSFRMRLWCS